MMASMKRQLTFFSLLYVGFVPEESWAYKLNAWAYEFLDEAIFAPLFSTIGRPSVAPYHTFLAILAQLALGCSDRDMERTTKYDIEVRYAIGIPNDSMGIDAATLCRHRKLFFEAGIPQIIFDQLLDSIVEAGFLGDDRIGIIDAFIMPGAAARQDTYTLIRTGIIKTLFLAKCCGVPIDQTGFRHADYTSRGKPEIDWSSSVEKQQLLTNLVLDALSVVEQVKSAKPDSEDLKEMTELLKTVATQDVKIVGEKVELVRGTAQDRVISIHDPEVRHGCKSKSSKTDGYKTTIAVDGEKGEFITAVDTVPANTPDGQRLEPIVEQLSEKGVAPDTLLGDTAYGDPKTKEKLAEEGITVEAKVSPSPKSKDKFGKDDFDIDLEEQTITCPNGETVEIPDSFIEGRKGGTIKFDQDRCNVCPMKEQCTSSSAGRTVRIHAYEAERLYEKKRQKTKEWKTLYKYRAHVERKIAHLKRNGARYGRYLGLKKT